MFYGCNMYLEVPKEMFSIKEWQNMLQEYIEGEKKMAVEHYKEEEFLKTLNPNKKHWAYKIFKNI
jgi:hypothetical protein